MTSEPGLVGSRPHFQVIARFLEDRKTPSLEDVSGDSLASQESCSTAVRNVVAHFFAKYMHLILYFSFS